jgi:hypothetical protein
MRAVIALALGSLAACGSASERSGSSEHAVTASQLVLYMGYSIYFEHAEPHTQQADHSPGYGEVVSSDSGRATALQHAASAKATMCGSRELCKQEAVTSFRLQLCLPGGPIDSAHCSEAAVGAEVGWVALAARFEAEANTLLAYLESHNFQAEGIRDTLGHSRDEMNDIRRAMDDAITGKATSTMIANAAHDRLATMGAAATSEEQLHLAETRRTISALEEVTARYQRDLDAQQPVYGDVAARHHAYRDTETDVFAQITAIANAASTANLSALASLKVQLAGFSDSENRNPQLLVLDANRVRWELASAQAAYELGLLPHMAFLIERSVPVLDHTSAPRTGMSNVVGYAEGRMRRINDAVREIYDGIRRREAALSLVAVDAATRDQLRAADAAQREATFLSDMTARAGDVWKTPPTSALNLPLQGERVTAMTSFLQLDAVCKDLSLAATWRAPGCGKVSAEASKIRTYLTQTLPFVLKFGVKKMRTAGYDAELLADIEAKIANGTPGALVEAANIYDAALLAAERS